MDSAQTFEDLDKRFGIAGKARVVRGNGGLAKVVISAEGCDGEIYLHGGHVTSWIPKGTGEIFYLSKKIALARWPCYPRRGAGVLPVVW